MNAHKHAIPTSAPRLTIGLPVRNGASHIVATLNSLLAQTFCDLRVIVYDNASTDLTPALVRQVSDRDARVTLVRHNCDIGGAANFIRAAELADTPLFCWAAHDDLRDSRFVETLVQLLDANPDAALACCAVRNMDPDGTVRDIRPETASLRTTTGMQSAARLAMYLRELPGTPFYGIFRTCSLHASLYCLRELHESTRGGPAALGIDMVFLANFLRDHRLAVSHEPLLHFRRGGVSHQLDRYGSLRSYLQQLNHFRLALRDATTRNDYTRSERMSLIIARNRSLVRWFISRDMRRMTACYLRMATPSLDGVRARAAAICDPVLRRLRSRFARQSSHRLTVVIFGAGKHTRRRISHLKHIVGKHNAIVACCDDHADRCEPIQGLPIVSPNSLVELKPDVLLVSSDTYERALYVRATQVAPAGTRVWAIYDMALETSDVAFTASMNADICAKPSA